ncbi:hypothetical protein H0G86_008319 [Trichoderma simmonsii]|uniref:Uncharacterized protein n=1 Tax=Trichoderma simmonsii TaxID=1491479 RepID=A0A8G0LI70_9HYPO|nr:hypothetical protein H0G86_008319 [Trichoderma simmonsii]
MFMLSIVTCGGSIRDPGTIHRSRQQKRKRFVWDSLTGRGGRTGVPSIQPPLPEAESASLL